MAEFDGLPQILFDGVRLEEAGFPAEASRLYAAAVRRYARIMPDGADALTAVFGANVYREIKDFKTAAEYATVAVYCRELLNYVRIKFPSASNYKAGERHDDALTVFLDWIGKPHTPTVGCYAVLKNVYDLLKSSESPLVLPVESAMGSLYAIIEGLGNGRYKYNGDKIRRR